jgi:outer membrane protein, heavy metal efflux system
MVFLRDLVLARFRGTVWQAKRSSCFRRVHMMRRYWVRLWICVAVGVGGGGSRSGAATFTVEGTVAQVRQRNPDLVAARMAIAEARGRRRQAGRLANPELETAVYPNVAGREGFLTFELNQRLPLTGRLRLEKTISETQIRVAEAEVAELERTLAGSAAVAAVEWGMLEREQTLRERQVANSRELREAATRVAAAAEGSSIEADQFAVESEQLEIRRLQLDAERAGVEGRLRPLLGFPASEPLRIELEPLDPAPEPGTTPAAFARSDQRVALERRRSAELSVALARAQRWQDIGIGVVGQGQRVQDVPVGLRDESFVGLQISVPLPLWNRNEGRIEEAKATLGRTDRELEAVELRIRSEVAAAGAQVRIAESVLSRVTTQLLPPARRVEDALERLRPTGQATVTEVLRARERRLLAESAGLEAERSLRRARVQWMTATGAILPLNQP